MKNNLNPLFSIVIPTYNRSSDLIRCLDSLVSQTYENFEVIVCDNGSTDDTKEVIEKYKELLNINDIYIKLNSGGPARPRNMGVDNAKGDWICFLDSDDWYCDNRLQYLAELNLQYIDFLYHDLLIIKNGKEYKTMRSRHFFPVGNSYIDFITGVNCIPTSSTCIRRTLLKRAGGFNESKDISGLEDFELWIRLSKLETRFKYLTKSLGSYAVGDHNFTFYDERQITRYKALYLLFIESENDEKLKRKIDAVMNYQIACIEINCKRFSKAYKLLWFSLTNGSFQLKKKVLTRYVYSFVFFLKNDN